MKLFKFLLIVMDVALAVVAAYILFPTLFAAAKTIPIAIAALVGAGILLAIYGDD